MWNFYQHDIRKKISPLRITFSRNCFCCNLSISVLIYILVMMPLIFFFLNKRRKKGKVPINFTLLRQRLRTYSSVKMTRRISFSLSLFLAQWNYLLLSRHIDLFLKNRTFIHSIQARLFHSLFWKKVHLHQRKIII